MTEMLFYLLAHFSDDTFQVIFEGKEVMKKLLEKSKGATIAAGILGLQLQWVAVPRALQM